ncbi:hypothetical protein VOLCADRAFT_105716 [Volvox carteri f. nagariensis]|uniref:Uncharacterized protein n=1 Tax=Volvox carteri f. nagariensis TaxID=3068 RepID=D8U2J1_VOLCA|nr:uncharacterized protein VOLCADRAFT_105716 [Volvox carteri f. nagariensis]EFJ46146.1 hypothetical protein VOLCADRAFT_105716 [Volvox carteri f. nagariensis]|eukprot:XP_002952896.1 hypothetical protein VOLCADRAFT_105716 [Volvox carteri f. nagariensis]
MSQIATEAIHVVQRAPMSITIGWLLSLPVSLPAWLLLSIWSRVLTCLRQALCVGGKKVDVKLPERPAAEDAHAQTELNMLELDKCLAMLDANEDAVCDHRKLLEVARKTNEALRTELDMTVDRMALLSQHNADLEGYKDRLLGTLRDVVLPVFVRLTQMTEDDDVHNITAEVFQALDTTRHLVSEAEGMYCATAEASPVEKPGDMSVRQSPFSDVLTQLTHMPRLATPSRDTQDGDDTQRDDIGRGFLSARQSSSTAKVLSFGSPNRSSTVVHILVHDVQTTRSAVL